MRVKVALALAMFLLTGAAMAGDVRTGPSDSPLTVMTRGAVSARIAEDVWELVRSRVGVERNSSVVQSTLLVDRAPFGGVATREAITVTLHDLAVRHPTTGETCVVEVTLAVTEGGDDVIGAFTACRDVWVFPDGPGGNRSNPMSRMEGLATVRGVEEAPPGAEWRMTIRDVLGQLWRWGIKPTEPGQIVIRPRMVLTTYPSSGEPLQESPPRWVQYWVVQASGSIVRHSRGSYYSERILFLCDENPDLMQSYYPQ